MRYCVIQKVFAFFVTAYPQLLVVCIVLIVCSKSKSELFSAFNEVDKFLVSIDNPNNENEKIDITLNSLSSVYFDVDVSSNTPKINIKFNLNGKIINNTDQISIYKQNNVINDNLKQYLGNKILDYLYKTSKEYNSDIECFYKIAKKEFLTNTDLDNYNWEEKYKNAEFNIEFNDDIITNLLIE